MDLLAQNLILSYLAQGREGVDRPVQHPPRQGPAGPHQGGGGDAGEDEDGGSAGGPEEGQEPGRGGQPDRRHQARVLLPVQVSL